jgi:glycosyltransferase involved in cell wall biosynthesis
MNARTEISLSVGVVTRHRPDALRGCLRSLRLQTVQPSEILVSDDSWDVESIQSNREACEMHGAVYVAGPRRGLYANRNQVWRSYRGSHLLQCDDDHVHLPDYLGVVMAAIRAEPESVHVFSEYLDDVGRLGSPIEYGIAGTACNARAVGSASIAEGTSVFPRGVTSRFRYYEGGFGPFYLLLGEVLKSAGVQMLVNAYAGTIHRATTYFDSSRHAADHGRSEWTNAMAVRWLLLGMRRRQQINTSAFRIRMLRDMAAGLVVGVRHAGGRLRISIPDLVQVYRTRRDLINYVVEMSCR